MSNLPATKPRIAVERFGMIVYSTPSRYGQPLLPVIRVLGQLDTLVRLVFDKLERSGADRVLAHLRRRDVARIDRRVARREQRQHGRLPLLQVQCRFERPVGRRFLQVDPPALAIIEAQLFLALIGQQVERAFDVGRGERLAVMPFDAVAQLEGQRGMVLVPSPSSSPAPARSIFRCSAARAGRT